MRVQLESDVDLDPDVKGAIGAGLAAMGLPDATVIVPEDFAQEVRNLTLAPEYSPDRVGGVVAGKTITTTTGEHVIVLNADAILTLERSAIERIAAHEAGHMLINSNHEDVTWADTANIQTVGWRRMMCYVASNAMDEYRVETAVMRVGYPSTSDSSTAEVAHALMDANAGSLEAVLRFRESSDILEMRDAAWRLMDRFSKQLADLIAGLPFSQFSVGDLDSAARSNWDAIVEPIWLKQVMHYRSIPDAKTRCSRPDVDAAVKRGWLVAVALLRSLGFEFRGGDDESFWSLRSDQQLDLAGHRWAADIEFRGDE